MPLPPLATAADLAVMLGRTFTPEQQAQAQALLDQASAVVRAYLRLDVSLLTTTDTFTVRAADRAYLDSPFETRRGQVVLPQRPVVAVTAVAVNGAATDDWELDGNRLLLRAAPWEGRSTVTVTYTHGWDPVPGDIAAIVMQAANRSLVNPEQIRSESVGGESTTYLIPASGEALGVLLSRTEQRVLDRYRRTSGTVRIHS